MSAVVETKAGEVRTTAEVMHRKSQRYAGPATGDVMIPVEAAVFLKCHLKTLTRMAMRGAIPYSLWRFSRPKLEEWMKQAA